MTHPPPLHIPYPLHGAVQLLASCVGVRRENKEGEEGRRRRGKEEEEREEGGGGEGKVKRGRSWRKRRGEIDKQNKGRKIGRIRNEKEKNW